MIIGTSEFAKICLNIILKKKELLGALKNSKVADVFSLNNDELVIEMTSPSGENFVVGNIRKYKGD